jgi:hypothetical protein
LNKENTFPFAEGDIVIYNFVVNGIKSKKTGIVEYIRQVQFYNEKDEPTSFDEFFELYLKDSTGNTDRIYYRKTEVENEIVKIKASNLDETLQNEFLSNYTKQLFSTIESSINRASINIYETKCFGMSERKLEESKKYLQESINDLELLISLTQQNRS